MLGQCCLRSQHTQEICGRGHNSKALPAYRYARVASKASQPCCYNIHDVKIFEQYWSTWCKAQLLQDVVAADLDGGHISDRGKPSGCSWVLSVCLCSQLQRQHSIHSVIRYILHGPCIARVWVVHILGHPSSRKPSG